MLAAAFALSAALLSQDRFGSYDLSVALPTRAPWSPGRRRLGP